MKYQKKCECCGHLVTAYTHNLNVPLARALRTLVDLYEARREPIALGELGLTTSQYTNFSHLQYFGLVLNTPEGWVPEELGIDFIYGRAFVLNPAGVMGGKVLSPGHEAWATHRGGRAETWIQELDEGSYKQRVDYQRERSASLRLF